MKNVINRRRLELRLNLEDVAKPLKTAHSTIQRWENGEAIMKRACLNPLAKILQLNPVDIVKELDTDDENKRALVVYAINEELEDLEMDDYKNIYNYIHFIKNRQ